jgi:hypothetical protein
MPILSLGHCRIPQRFALISSIVILRAENHVFSKRFSK